MNTCDLCDAPKAPRTCGECGAHICKNCVQFVPTDRMRFHPDPPAWSAHGIFCANCFSQLVEQEIQRYDEVAQRAELVKLVFDTFRGYIPCLRKAKEWTTVDVGDAGRGIALHRLQFLSAWDGYDAVIEVVTKHEKVHNHGYETKIWTAKGTFASIDYKRFHPPE